MMKKGCFKLTIACLVLTGLAACGKKDAGGDNQVEVKTMTVAETSADGEMCYSGTIEANSGTAVSFATAGTVKKVYVNDGQTVRAGQVIAEIDATTLQNAHKTTLSMLHQAQDAYSRMKKLHDGGSISEMQWVEVQSKLEQAVSSEEIARRALKDARILAPCNGVIADKSLEPGQNVLPSVSVMKIVDISKVKVNISVPENEIGSIGNGATVTVTVPALDGASFSGNVTEKDVTANTLSRTYNVKATIPNPGHRLMPGMICDARVSSGQRSVCVCLPIDAVQLSDKNFYFVWTVENGKAKKRFVEIGTVTSDGVTVKDGLKSGDKVIIEGQQKVCDGTKVKSI